MKQEIGLDEVARAVGLSKSSVSRALRNDPQQSETTRRRVRAAAEKLGYRPGPMMSAWMSQVRRRRASAWRRPVLTILDTWKVAERWRTWDTLRDFDRGFCARADALGYRVDRISLHASGMNPERLRKILDARGATALLIFPFEEPDIVLDMDLRGLALATMGLSLKKPDIPRVGINYQQIWLDLMNELMSRGFRRPGLCARSSTEMRTGGHWHAAFWTAWRHANLPGIPLEFIIENKHGPETRKLSYQKWLKRAKPDVVAFTEIPTLKELADRSRAVVLLADCPDPEIAQIYKSWEAVGAATADLLVDQLHRNQPGVPELAEYRLLPGRLVDGPSLQWKA